MVDASVNRKIDTTVPSLIPHPACSVASSGALLNSLLPSLVRRPIEGRAESVNFRTIRSVLSRTISVCRIAVDALRLHRRADGSRQVWLSGAALFLLSQQTRRGNTWRDAV